MNSNSFTASLTNGYGQPVSPQMLEILGLADIPDETIECLPEPMPVPAAGCARLPSAANQNLRRAV